MVSSTSNIHLDELINNKDMLKDLQITYEKKIRKKKKDYK